ncbi:unnamed protein product [Caenorhabditis brenneri]
MSSLSAAFVMLLMRGVQIISPGFLFFWCFFAIEDFSFYTLLGSYVGSAILLYLATVRPVFYSLRVSVRTVYGCAAANVIGSIVISVLAAVFQAAEQSQGPYRCGEHCKHVIIIVMEKTEIKEFQERVSRALSWITRLTRYITNKEKETPPGTTGSFSSNTSIFKSARTRLAWTLFTFTLISLSEAMPTMYLIGLNIGKNVPDSDITKCSNFYQADHLIYPAIMSSFQTLAWAVALVVDPLCGLLFDPRVRKVSVRHISNLKSLLTSIFCCTMFLTKEDEVEKKEKEYPENSEDFDFGLEEMIYVEEVETIVFWIGLIAPFTLLSMATFLNAYFLYALIPEFRKMNDTTKKQYIFVLSRGMSSLSAAFVMLLMRGLQIISPGFFILMLFFAIEDVSFYTLLGSYVGSAILLYLATVRPVFYSLRVSVRTVYGCAAANVIGSIVISVIAAVFQAAEQSQGPFQCGAHCQHVITVVMVSITMTAFTIPIITLSFVLVTLCLHGRRHESQPVSRIFSWISCLTKYITNKEDEPSKRTKTIGSFSSDSSVFKSARTRLAWTLFTFTLISLSEAMPTFYLVRLNINSDMTECVNFYQADHLIYPAIMSSFQTLAWAVALVVDPLCGLLFDPRIRNVSVRHITNLKSLLTSIFCCTMFLTNEDEDEKKEKKCPENSEDFDFGLEELIVMKM